MYAVAAVGTLLDANGAVNKTESLTRDTLYS